MDREAQPPALRGYLPHVVAATFAVGVLPALVVLALQAGGVLDSALLSIPLAMALSMAASAAGSAWWVRRPGSRDLVFADLMVWGWLRRVRSERRLADARALIGSDAALDPAGRAELLRRLAGALEARDAYTHGHSKRVARHAEMIARRIGLDRDAVAAVRTAAALHDVGKLDTPRAILTKPGRLTDAEFATIKRHPVDGARMVARIEDPELVAMVRHHHERLDGNGYPDGLRGEDIPLGARIIAVADTFDALTSSRPYRSGAKHKRALDVLREEAGTQLDPGVVTAFRAYYSGRRPLAWWTVLVTAPPRAASWLVNAIEGAGAPLAGGVGAAGAVALIGGALAGSPPADGATATSRAATARPVALAATPHGAAAGAQASTRPRRRPASRRAGAPRTRPGAGRSAPGHAAPTAPGDRGSAPGTGASASRPAGSGSSASGATPSGGSGATGSGGGGGGGGDGGGTGGGSPLPVPLPVTLPVELPAVDDVVQVPDVPPLPVPTAPALPAPADLAPTGVGLP